MYLLPITYVSIAMVIALLGNLLVIIVFKCRWRTTGSTQIYILALATLDLVCAIASMPRLLLAFVAQRDNAPGTNASDCLICRHNSYMQGFCKVTVFLTFQLNLTTAFILVVIATSRCVRVMNEGRGFSFQGRVKVKSMKVKLMKILNAMSTVPGAKKASAVCFCVALVITCPTIVFHASNVDRKTPTTMNSIGNTTDEPEQQSCFQSCLNDIHEDYQTPLNALMSFYFGIFLGLAAAMVILYSAILRKLWEKRKEKIPDLHNHRQSSVFGSRRYRQSSVFVSRQSGSLGTLCEAVHEAMLDSKRQVVRTMSEGDAVATNPEEKNMGDAHTKIHPRSVSNPCNNTDKGSIMSEGDVVARSPEGNTTGGAQREIHPRSDSSPCNNTDKGRTMSEDDAEASNPEAKTTGCAQPEIRPSSVSHPRNNTDKGSIMSEGEPDVNTSGGAQPEIRTRSAVSNPRNNTDKGRIVSEGDAEATNPEGNTTGGAEPEIRPSSDSSPCNNTGKGSIMSTIDAKATNAEGNTTEGAQPEIHPRSVSNPCNDTDKGCFVSEGDTEGNTTGFAQPEIHPRSDSSPYTNRDKARIMQGITGGLPRPRCDSDPSRGEGNERKQQTIFPPVSYSAQLRSMLNLNVAERVEEDQVSMRSRQASVSSFQFSKYGNRARETTIVFVLITAIYILSYLPFFITVISKIEVTTNLELLSKSYLISNAANPLVYGLCNPYFRNTLWKLLVCRRDVI